MNPTAAFCCKILLAKVIFLFQIIVFITFFNLFFVFSAPATKQICPQSAIPNVPFPNSLMIRMTSALHTGQSGRSEIPHPAKVELIIYNIF